MLMLSLMAALATCALVAWAGRSLGLQKLSLVLILNFAVCNVVVHWGLVDMPLRAAVFAVVDGVSMGLSLAIMYGDGVHRGMRRPFLFTYICMLTTHAAVLIGWLSRRDVYVYDAILNILFVSQMLICTGAGLGNVVGMVREYLDRRNGMVGGGVRVRHGRHP